MDTPRAYVVASGTSAIASRDALTAAGALIFSASHDVARSDVLLLASRLDVGATRGLVASDARVFAELAEEQLTGLPVSSQILVRAAQRPRTREKRLHEGRAWDAPGMQAPRKLKRQR